MTDLSSLRDADAAAARSFLTVIGAEDLVAAIRATSDEDLLSVVGRKEIRPVAVEVILSRLHEYAVPERLVLLNGVVRFDLQRRGRLLERHGLELRDGEIKARPDIGADEPVDVVLTTNVVRFLRLVSGERNAGLEYLAGTLDIQGDAALAIGLGGIFRVPGTHQVAMDATALDPVAVATVLRTVPLGHLRKVMASGFRPDRPGRDLPPAPGVPQRAQGPRRRPDRGLPTPRQPHRGDRALRRPCAPRRRDGGRRRGG